MKKDEVLFLSGPLKERIWGGKYFKDKLHLTQSEENFGELWSCSGHKEGESWILNGTYKGQKLSEVFLNHKELFNDSKLEEFPILVKLISTCDKLSVQVHPNDEYAKRVENSYGKTEAWYVVDAKDDAEFFSIITCVEGKGAINYKNKTEIIAKGDSILIPVQLGEYEIKGEVEILISKPVI